MVTPHLTLSLFLIAQLCDGVFTYFGVHAMGIAAEGNLLLATWMALVGPGPALVGAKLLAGACGVLLHLRGVHRTLALLTALYAVGAVGSWLYVLQRI